jgi:ABC-type branched-subunit amino acid transport system substrate-binding protein
MRFHWKILSAAAIAGLGIATLGSAAVAEPGVTKDEIVIGSSLDLSGPGAPIGAPMKRGLDIGTQMINDHGGINGRKLKVIVYDNALQVPKGLLAVDKLLNQDHVFAFVALMGSPLVQAAQHKIMAAGRPIMFPIAPLDALYNPPQHLLVAFEDDFADQFARATAWALADLHVKRVCLLESQGLDNAVHDAVIKELKQHQLTLAGYESYGFGAVDLSSQVARLKADGCDLVLLNSLVRDAAAAVRERQKIGWNANFMVAQSSTGIGLVALGGKASEGIYGITTQLAYHAIKDFPVVKELTKRFQAAYHGEPDEGFFGGYQALALFAEAARRAGPDLTVASLLKGVDSMKDFDTGTGHTPMTFSETQRLGSADGYIIQVRHGQWDKVAEF